MTMNISTVYQVLQAKDRNQEEIHAQFNEDHANLAILYKNPGTANSGLVSYLVLLHQT